MNEPDAKGAVSLAPATGTSGGSTGGEVDCNPESGSKKLKVKLGAVVKVKVGASKMTATATASDFAVATFKVIQNGKTLSRKVYVLKPKKKLKAPLKLLGSSKLAKGKATLQVSTFSVDGVRQTFKKTFKVK